MTKGIVLAGGSGTRLHPSTLAISKQILPIFDKPMIYYPISILMQAGIREILIISTPHDMPIIKKLLGSGKKFGIDLHYEIQKKPEGLAQSFIIGREFIGQSNVCLILGDNFFYGDNVPYTLKAKIKELKPNHASIFGYSVNNPSEYGVIELSKSNEVISIEEKPTSPKSNIAQLGLYFYDNNVIDIASELKPSSRGELEITDLNVHYLKENRLNCHTFDGNFTWFDTGTPEKLLEAANFVQLTQNKKSKHIGCLEEIAFKNNWIDLAALIKQQEKLNNSDYGNYLKKIIKRIS